MRINEYLKVGTTIKELRIAKGMTQREMANKLGLSFSTYSNYENNYREPKFEIIEKVAEILDVTIDYIIGNSSSETLIEQYGKKRGVFNSYLYSLGFSVETPLSSKKDTSKHYIGYNNRNNFKVVDANLFKNFQEECNNYVTYLMNNLLEQSIDIEDYTEELD